MGWTVGRWVDCNIKSNVRNCVAWLSQVLQRSVPYDILHWFPASGWTRTFRLDYIELPWVRLNNSYRNIYTSNNALWIYFIHHYHFFFKENCFLLLLLFFIRTQGTHANSIVQINKERNLKINYTKILNKKTEKKLRNELSQRVWARTSIPLLLIIIVIIIIIFIIITNHSHDHDHDHDHAHDHDHNHNCVYRLQNHIYLVQSFSTLFYMHCSCYHMNESELIQHKRSLKWQKYSESI